MGYNALLIGAVIFFYGYSSCNCTAVGLREQGDELVYTKFRDITSPNREDISIDFSYRDDYNVVLRITQGHYNCNMDTNNMAFILYEKEDTVLVTRLTAKNATYMHCTESIFGFYKTSTKLL